MSIFVSEQLCVQLRQLASIGIKQQGSYAVRLHLYYKYPDSDQLVFYTPTSVIPGRHPHKRQQGSIQDNGYVSRPVTVRYETENLPVDEICLFRTRIDTSRLPLYRNMTRILYCELLHEMPFLEGDERYSKCSQFTAELRNQRLANYIELCFDEQHACTVDGSVHSIIYKAEFVSNEQQVMASFERQKQQRDRMHIKIEGKERSSLPPIFSNLEDYVVKNSKQKTEPLLQFFLEAIGEESKLLEQKFREYVEMGISSESIPDKEAERLSDLVQEERSRKKIFENSPAKIFEGRMHRYANRIYALWGHFVLLVLQIPNDVVQSLRKVFKERLQEKWGESVVRLEYQAQDWSVQKYADSGKEHLTTAQKLRELSIDLETSQRLPFSDREVFGDRSHRSILFDEIYIRPGRKNIPEQKRQGRHLVVLVHGLGACRQDMEKLAIELKRAYRVSFLLSSSNQGRTEGDIGKMGQRLAKEVMDYIVQRQKTPHLVSFVGHSMGSVIIRAALPHMEELKKLFYCYVSISSPHVGYLYNPSTLIDAGLWLINTVQKCTSVQQLCLQDSQQIQDTFIYRLSREKGLQWFSKVALFSSYQDSYVPYDCARIQKGKQAVGDSARGLQKGVRYCQMVDSIIGRLSCARLHRIDINMEISGQSVDTLIGRAAHINFVNCMQLIKLIVNSCQDIFT